MCQQKQAKVNERIGDLMGGRVVKMEWLERYDKAVSEGRAEGKEDLLISQICRKMRKGKEISQIADELEEDEIRVKVICDLAAPFAPDYDEESVIRAIRAGSAVS